MKKSLILLASMLICPLLAGCSGEPEPTTTEPAPTTTTTTTSEEPGHTHSYDEFGVCECGDVQETAGLQWLEVGKEQHAVDSTAGKVELFKLHGAPNHKFIFSIQRFFKIALVEWVQDGTVHKVENPTSSTEFAPTAVLTYYVKAVVEDGNDGTVYFKYAWNETPTHTPDEKGICDCGTFVGKTLATCEDDTIVLGLGYLSTYDAYGAGIDWVRFTIAEGVTKFYIGGHTLAARHTIGLWAPDGTKISDAGYNLTKNDPAPGTYILKVTKSSMGIDAGADVYVRTSEVLAGWESATNLTLNTAYTTAVPLNVGAEASKFKVRFGAGLGKDRWIKLTVSGTAISAANHVEIKWFDYKGDPVTKNDMNCLWGTRDGYMYMSAVKTADDGNSSQLSRILVESLDTRIAVITDGQAETDLHDHSIETYKEFWLSFVITEANVNYGISFHTTGGAFTRRVYGPDGVQVPITDTYVSAYKYNFTPTATGLHSIRLYATEATSVVVASGAVVRIDPAV